MIGREYLLRQAMTLLRFSREAKDPELSAKLAVKAADLKEQLDDAEPQDTSPAPPDIAQH